MAELPNLEFYDGNTVIASVNSSIVPHPGSTINIRNKNWHVKGVTYALDYADKPSQRSVCAAVHLKAI